MDSKKFQSQSLNDSSSQNSGDSLSSEKAADFNQKVEDMSKNNYKQQIEAQKKQFEDKINGVLGTLCKMSLNSQHALTLFQQLNTLSPILQEIGAAVATVDNDVYYKLYIKFRNIFKLFNNSADQCTKLSKESSNGNMDPVKMEEIKKSILNVSEQLLSIKQNVYKETQRYIIWIDFKDSKENKQTLLQLQHQHKTSITVKFYTNLDTFKKEFINFEGQPLFFILSGAVANNFAKTDGYLFQWLKERWMQDKIKIRIRGIIIYTSYEGIKHCQKLQEDKSKLVVKITDDTNEMLETLQKMISPGKFCRLVGIEEYSHFFKNEFKDKLLNMHSQDRSKMKIQDFSPKIIDYQMIFNEAKELVQQYKINLDSKATQFDLVLQHLMKVFQTHQNEQQLAKALIHLYSLEKVPFYNLINSTLNTMNERLIEKLWPVIELFATTLYHYDDTPYPEGIKKGGKDLLLYRGSSIPNENYSDICQVNNYVTLPSFSSFTPDLNVAINFVGLNSFADTIPCIFIYTHNSIGSKQYDQRPKFISNDCKFQKEKEYLTYPCVCYRIASIIPKSEGAFNYQEIKLLLN